MPDRMTFPKTFDEFAEHYKIVDKKEVYTNGTELIPIFRVKQWLEHATTEDVVEVRHGHWGFDGLGWTCSECGEYALTNKSKMQVHSVWCPHCGAKMDGERKENTE